MRAKRFRANYSKNTEMLGKNHSRKQIFTVGAIYLILLLCLVFYAICIHYDLFGVRDWDAEDIKGQSQDQAAPIALESEPAAHIEHVVSSGETIWDISLRYHPNEDTRKANWAIRAFNPGTDGERMSAKIIPGQVIRVPVDIDAVEEVEEVKEVMEATEENDQREVVEVASRHDDSRDYGK